jgi:hypothetical protein
MIGVALIKGDFLKLIFYKRGKATKNCRIPRVRCYS